MNENKTLNDSKGEISKGYGGLPHERWFWNTWIDGVFMPNIYRTITYKNREGWIEGHEVGWSRMLQAVTWFILYEFSKEKIVVTSGYRKGDKGVHGTIPLRAIDISSQWLHEPFALCDKVNSCFQYDDKRPEMLVALYHAVCPKCGTDNRLPYHDLCIKCMADIKAYWHIHAQVHPRTTIKKEG